MKKSNPLLFCDDCKCPINEPEEALAAWAPNDEGQKRVMVVHELDACPRWKHVVDRVRPHRPTVPLHHYLGHRGLCTLLSDMERGELHPEAGFALIRRLHVRGYEEYRRLREKAVDAGVANELPLKASGRHLRIFQEWLKEQKQKEAP